jgi:hypothetical protein
LVGTFPTVWGEIRVAADQREEKLARGVKRLFEGEFWLRRGEHAGWPQFAAVGFGQVDN